MSKELRLLATKAKEFYPQSKNMRKQWVHKTVYLINSGKHVLNGGVPNWKFTSEYRQVRHG